MTINTPNKANLLRWVRALESGEYGQTEGQLRGGDGSEDCPYEYCCLGVACEMAREDVGGKWEGNEFRVFVDGTGKNPQFTHMPAEVSEWLGIDHGKTGGNLGFSDGELATELNDTRGWSFAEIAKKVREEFNLPTREQDAHMLAWIEALESGEFDQAKGCLRKAETARAQGGDNRAETGYCCLGVACEVARKAGAVDGEWEANTERPQFVVRKDGEAEESAGGALPLAVQDWLGVDSSDPRVLGTCASTRNDQDGWTFAEIATALREQFGYPPKAETPSEASA